MVCFDRWLSKSSIDRVDRNRSPNTMLSVVGATKLQICIALKSMAGTIIRMESIPGVPHFPGSGTYV